MDERKDRLAKLRRQPPAFRRVTVVDKADLSPRMVRVTLGGDALAGLVVDQPASSVRLLLPTVGASDLVMPEWDGNEFLLPDGSRPVIRTFTPPLQGSDARTMQLDLVVHDGGAASEWARRAVAGDEAAISGPGRGYEVDAAGDAFLLLGDETAIPALRQLLRVLPATAAVQVEIEVADPAARLDLGETGRATIRWHDLPDGSAPGDTLVSALGSVSVDASTIVWAAGEAAAMQRIRGHLFDVVGLPRSAATVRGYWKRRAGSAG